MPPLAMWAGIECTVNRVGDRYFDQVSRSGHHDRESDVDLLAGLGVRTLRYPVLWERTAPDELAGPDWAWADRRLARLRELGVDVIAGLVHHGSGPRSTSLLDREFPLKLSRYAARVAARYPWLTSFTPVNEPLTTARFSGLYGLWYPHGRDDAVFARCLITQCKAIAMSMQAIRRVTPNARLVTTEDLSATHAAPRLRYQAEFENERRWLSLDLLCGRVTRRHALWGWLVGAGIAASELDWFLDQPTPPDVVGCNYYVTSERYLDDRIELWPTHEHGGNGRDRYADVAAVRACETVGPSALLAACYRRFGIPVAITEAHLGCTREDQLRWLTWIHDQVCAARRGGVPVVALTVWAAFGSYDWSSLVTRDEGSYEPGMFDVRGASPRPTALAAWVREIAAGRRPHHPVLAGRGWWERVERKVSA